ncbi:MAG: HNH endonuclease [Sphingobacteriaceae bacterium]|nr:MAG: HNH endonuclease [Sphingobacteriaceae bacterium]
MKFLMNCLFCKRDSSTSRSVEHIIPESLGNKEYILPKEMVCDKCNQYFAIKIEKPLLEQPYFKHLRYRSKIENKKRNVPTLDVMAIGLRPMKVELSFDKKDGFSITIPDDVKDFFSSPIRKIIIPILDAPKDNNLIVSKFLAKLANEALIHQALGDEKLLEELWNHPGVDRLKQYARYGQNVSFWPYHQRRIYSEGTIFRDTRLGENKFEILHEFTFLYPDESSLYFIVCIMGIEYVINMNAPEINGYSKWLVTNDNKSPLDDINEVKL